MLHPLIRVICFLILALMLTLGRPVVAGMALILLGGLCLGVRGVFAASWPMLRRLRWFLLSILIIYLWATPGRPLWPGYDAVWLPTIEGVSGGVWRIITLITLTVAVTALLRLTPREQLLQSIHQLAYPLGWLGLSRERLAIRMTLTLESVTRLQAWLAQRQPLPVTGSRMQRITASAAALVEEVIARAEREPCDAITLPEATAPPPLQWLWPAALVLLVIFSSVVAG